MIKEIFKSIPNYEGHYEVSNLGNIKSLRNDKLLNASISIYGYLIVNLYKNKQSKICSKFRKRNL